MIKQGQEQLLYIDLYIIKQTGPPQRTFLRAYIYIHTHTHIHVYLYMYVNTHTYIYIHEYTYIYTYTNIDICAHIYPSEPRNWPRMVAG